MEDDSVTSFLVNVVDGDLEKKIIRLLSEEISQEEMLKELLAFIEEAPLDD